MKTPREILLAQHRDAESKLDALTAFVVNNIQTAVPPRPQIWQIIWRELVLPSRQLWAGLAAIWAVILVANLNFRANSPRLSASISPAAARNFMSVREQENIVTAFNALPEPAPVAEPPKSRASQPRTELSEEFFTI